MFVVKMTKCRPYVHSCACREGVVNTPCHHTVVSFLIDSARSHPHGILNEVGFSGFTGDYAANGYLRPD